MFRGTTAEAISSSVCTRHWPRTVSIAVVRASRRWRPTISSTAAGSKRRRRSPTRSRSAPADHILDIGSGIGGPARYFAHRFGCNVTGIDLTAEFCDVADDLTRLLGLEGKVRFEVGDALAMPFATGGFDGAYSMNVSMNIADKGGFYREIHRVLKPGAG